MSRRVLGIDLGTVNSCVAIVEDGKAVVLGEGQDRTIPSCLAIKDGKELVGQAARRQLVTDPRNTVTAVKRLIGHSFDSQEVQSALARSPYPIVPSPLGTVMLEVGGRELTPVQVSARVLQEILDRATELIGEPVTTAVISVPAHFTDVQRKATKLAAEYAGIEVLRLINEPTAAAFAYGYRKAENFTLAVYDLGGGTFDVTVMRAIGDSFEVIGTDGDSFLGGEDFDHAVAEWLLAEFETEFGAPLEDEAGKLRIREAAEKAKIELSAVEETSIDLPYLATLGGGENAQLTRTVTREKLTELTRGLMQKTLDLCTRCLADASLDKDDIDEVLLVGGQSRMPVVRYAVRDFFGKEPRRDINPDEVVAMGAALYGYSLCADQFAETAMDQAEDAYEVALKDAEIARKLLDEIKLRKEDNTDRAELKSRLNSLLEQTEDEVGPPTLREPRPEQSLVEDVRQSTERLQAEISPMDSLEDLPAAPVLERQVGEQDLGSAVKDVQAQVQGLQSEAREVLEALADELAAEEDESTQDTASTDSDSEGQAIGAAAERLSALIGNAAEASSEAVGNMREAGEHAQARKVTLADVTSHALGIAAAEDLFMSLIAQNTKIPAESRRVFTTNQDGQSEVNIRIFQGRESKATENQLLGDFVLEGIATAARMEPKIEVAFAIDENGILSVKARDKRSGIAQQIRIEDPLGLQANDAGVTGPESMIEEEDDGDFEAVDGV
ncbi:MAG: Hsp70 family protein [Deltaproteobacteria bacterium]|nr:Hsp70 family protein [Deltaproteobacteria bacterium]